MIRGDSTYLKHFHSMVTMGIACGLANWIEWLYQYDCCIGEPYEMYNEISEFCTLVGKELYENERCIDRDTATKEQVEQYIMNYYHKPLVHKQ